MSMRYSIQNNVKGKCLLLRLRCVESTVEKFHFPLITWILTWRHQTDIRDTLVPTPVKTRSKTSLGPGLCHLPGKLHESLRTYLFTFSGGLLVLVLTIVVLSV